MTVERIEYRAIIRRPSSILDSAEQRELGYVDYPSGYAESQKEIRDTSYDLRRSEETHAYVHHWERRVVIVGEWEEMA